MTTVAASVLVLRWAAKRARLDDGDLAARFHKWPLWLTGEAQPTLKQLEDFARLTHTAIGYFFLPQPPALVLPVPDFRILRDEALAEPSSDLLEVISKPFGGSRGHRPDEKSRHRSPAADRSERSGAGSCPTSQSCAPRSSDAGSDATGARPDGSPAGYWPERE